MIFRKGKIQFLLQMPILTEHNYVTIAIKRRGRESVPITIQHRRTESVPIQSKSAQVPFKNFLYGVPLYNVFCDSHLDTQCQVTT